LRTLLTRFIAGLLFGVTATDAWSYSAAGGLLVLVAAITMLVPVRATRIDPRRTLQSE
jgi:hypothetical protein